MQQKYLIFFPAISKYIFISLFVLMLAAFGCVGGSDSGGDDSNSQFHGSYDGRIAQGNCEISAITLTIGTDKDNFEIGEDYIYIPGSGSSDTFSYADDDETVTVSVSISGDTISISQTGPDWSRNLSLSYSDNYNLITIDGELTSSDLEDCPGTISGTMTKYDGSNIGGEDEDKFMKGIMVNILKFLNPVVLHETANSAISDIAGITLDSGCYSTSLGLGTILTYNCDEINGSITFSGPTTTTLKITYNNLTVDEGDCTISGTLVLDHVSDTITYTNLSICGETYSGSIPITANDSSGINESSPNGVSGATVIDTNIGIYSITASNVLFDNTCAWPVPNSGTLTIIGPDDGLLSTDFSSTTCSNQTITYTYDDRLFYCDLTSSGG